MMLVSAEVGVAMAWNPCLPMMLGWKRMYVAN